MVSSFSEQATGNGSVSSTPLYAATVSIRSRLRREKGAEQCIQWSNHQP